MCGIAGIIEYASGSPDREALERMTTLQRHRGPDADGFFVRENIGFGHRRLSIIDLEGGHQPWSNEDGTCVITYNGEVYNYLELRARLEAKGRRFRSHSDTEVVLQAYEEWGKNCVRHFEGMFAFAIADFRKKEVFLARDHFGIKPLIYFYNGRRFCFASEIQALRASPEWVGEINLESIDQFLRLQYIPSPATAFRQTYKLPPAHCITLRMGEPHLKLERYWTPEDPSQRSQLRGDITEELDHLLRDSVKRHLVSDVPFGAFLSGGVDSSLIVAYMTEVLGKPVQTFSIGFDDAKYNELPMARAVATRYNTDHHEEIVHPDALGILPEVVRHHGEPFGDQSAIPCWYLSQVARSKVPMVLSGDGGDEFFGGYSTYGGWLRRMRTLGWPAEETLRNKRLAFARRMWPSRYETPHCPGDDSQNWMDFVGRFRFEERQELWRPEFRFLSDAPDYAISKALLATPGVSLSKVRRADLETFLPDDIMSKVDISTMSFGLEARPPILDRRVFDFARRMAQNELCRVDSAGAFHGKLPLKKILASRLGDEFVNRPKQGFEVPLHRWLFEDARARGEVHERLLSGDAVLNQWFETKAIAATVQSENAFNVWLLIVLDEWLRQMKPIP